MANYVLVHHGIKGQKWGVRRFQNKSGALTSAGRKRYGVGKEGSKSKEAADAVKESAKSAVTTAKQKQPKVHEDYAKAHAKKPVQSLSDKELKEINARLQAEQTYKNLNPEKKSIGRKFVDTFIIPAATEIGKEYAKTYMKKGASKLEDMLKKKNGDDKGEDKPPFDPIKPKVPPSDDPGGNGKKGKTRKTGKTDDNDDGKQKSPFDKAWEDRQPNKQDKDPTVALLESRTTRTENANKVNTSPVKSMAVDIFTGNPSVNDVVTVFQGVKAKADSYAPQASLGEAFVAGLLPPPKEDRG